MAIYFLSHPLSHLVVSACVAHTRGGGKQKNAVFFEDNSYVFYNYIKIKQLYKIKKISFDT